MNHYFELRPEEAYAVGCGGVESPVVLFRWDCRAWQMGGHDVEDLPFADLAARTAILDERRRFVALDDPAIVGVAHLGACGAHDVAQPSVDAGAHADADRPSRSPT